MGLKSSVTRSKEKRYIKCMQIQRVLPNSPDRDSVSLFLCILRRLESKLVKKEFERKSKNEKKKNPIINST